MTGWTEDQLKTLESVVTICLRHVRREHLFPIVVRLVSSHGLPADRAKRVYHELVDKPIPDADDVIAIAAEEFKKGKWRGEGRGLPR